MSNPRLPQPLPAPVFSEPSFAEPVPIPDPAGFVVNHPSDGPLYTELRRLHLDKAYAFPKSRLADNEVLPLESAFGARGAQAIQQIQAAGRIVFHAVGDTGSTKGVTSQNIVTDAMVADCEIPDSTHRPVFFYHLGDIVYSFAEAVYYYDQFYEPYRNYPNPIFAIPGNHEGVVSPEAPAGVGSLDSYFRNFCAQAIEISPDAMTLHRTAMQQPGAYFALDCPFVRIIGLYSNALEDPGLISSEKHLHPHGQSYNAVPDFQLSFLEAQLQKIKDEHYQGCVLLAVHHPPFSFTPPNASASAHGSSPIMLKQIDKICHKVGIYPHAVLSAHAHNYQRYTRTVKMGTHHYDVPFIICGTGGHGLINVASKKNTPHVPAPVDHIEKGLLFEKFNDLFYGYLRVSVDAQQLRIAYHNAESPSSQQSEFDTVTVDLATHTMVSN
jgi:hypothetical protein